MGKSNDEEFWTRAAKRKAADDAFDRRMDRLRVILGIYLICSILLWNFALDENGARRDAFFALVPAAFIAFKACVIPRDARLMWGLFLPVIAACLIGGILMLAGVWHPR